MELDKIAKKLGYRDVEHLEMNIENYGSPLSEWWKVMQEVASNTEIIGNVMPFFEFSGVATKYNQGVAVDTDGIALSNDILPHKAYTLEEGVKYTVKIYKA